MNKHIFKIDHIDNRYIYTVELKEWLEQIMPITEKEEEIIKAAEIKESWFVDTKSVKFLEMVSKLKFSASQKIESFNQLWKLASYYNGACTYIKDSLCADLLLTLSPTITIFHK